MFEKVISSAPAKIIITGEHSVVYGEPALLASLNYRCKAKLRRLRRPIVRLYSNKLKQRRELEIGNVRNYWKSAIKAWCMFNSDGNVKGLKKFRREKFVVMLCGVGLCLEEIGDLKRGIDIKIESELPIISGFGSSAYVAASVIGGIGKLMGKVYDRDGLFKRVYEVEKIIHGKPSGGDPAIVVNGGFIEFQKKNDKFKFKPLQVNTKRIPEIFIINSGKTKESTGEMVNLVQDRMNSNRKRYSKVVGRMGELSYKFMRTIERGIIKEEMIKDNEGYLEELGVVGETAQGMIRLIEKVGGVAKISGSGGIKSGSGVMIALHKNREKLLSLINKNKWQYFPVKLGEEGWKIE